MTGPVMHASKQVAPETHAISATYPLPGLGVLPIRAHLIQGREPVLVDTGVAALREPFLDALESLIDPRDLRWIWITHTDLDHVGNLEAVLDAAPQATVITTYLGLGKLGLKPLVPARFHLLNPGQEIEVGDRKLLAVTPPTFDAPETTGFLDRKTGALFSADSFGAVLDSPAEEIAEIDSKKLQGGMETWATVDAPWLRGMDAEALNESLDEIRRLDPSTILSSHLPPATGMTEILLGHLASARHAPAFVGPDQAALERMMAGVGGESA